MRVHYANIPLMRPLWADRDPAIRVTARSICALFAKQLLRHRLGEGELSWLHEVMDKPSYDIFNEHNNRASMNVDAFVDGVLLYQRDELPNELADSFKQTLMVLMKDMYTNSQTSVHTDTFEGRLAYHIQRIEQDNGRQDHDNRDNVVKQLRRLSSSATGTSSTWDMKQFALQHGLNGTPTGIVF